MKQKRTNSGKETRHFQVNSARFQPSQIFFEAI